MPPMTKHLTAAALLAGTLLAGVAVAVQDEPSTRPAEDSEPAEPAERAGPAERAIRTGQVVRPYNLLDDLTPEQEEQLGAIRAEYLRGVRDLRDREREQSLAVLTEDQRGRLDDLEAERRREARERRAERRAEREAEEGEATDDETADEE